MIVVLLVCYHNRASHINKHTLKRKPSYICSHDWLYSTQHQSSPQHKKKVYPLTKQHPKLFLNTHTHTGRGVSRGRPCDTGQFFQKMNEGHEEPTPNTGNIRSVNKTLPAVFCRERAKTRQPHPYPPPPLSLLPWQRYKKKCAHITCKYIYTPTGWNTHCCWLRTHTLHTHSIDCWQKQTHDWLLIDLWCVR